MSKESVAAAVSRETLERLAVYVDLLERWNPRINLVSPRSLADVWDRHIADSLQFLALAPNRTEHWVDLGSGGGLPAVVVAIAVQDWPDPPRITCVESDQRKAVFLRSVSRETAVPFRVETTRIEALAPQSADVVSARALAPLDRLLGYAQRHCAPHGVALLAKGRNHAEERKAAEKNWRFAIETHTSETDPSGVIYRIGEIARV